MDRGWVKLYRQITEWEWFTDPATAHLFIYLLAKANRKPTRRKGVEIPAGGLATSREALSKATGLSEQQVRTALKHLISTNEITKSATAKFTLLIVNNWDCYQHDNQQNNQQLTSNQPTTNQQLTTNKKERSKEVKNTTTTTSETESFSPQKAPVIDKTFHDYKSEIRNLLKELSDIFEPAPTAATFGSWRKALAKCRSDEERIRMIQYSLGNNKNRRIYKRLYPERGVIGERKGTPDWYDKVPTERSTPESLEEARRLREEILGGKQ